MTTTQKIERLGELYREACHCRDHFALVQDRLNNDEMAELLPFARMIAADGDSPMQALIDAMRGMLENAVHTVAGR